MFSSWYIVQPPRSSEATAKTKWDKSAARFLSKVPTTAADWLQKRLQCELSTPEQIINAFQLFTSAPQNFSCRPGRPTAPENHAYPVLGNLGKLIDSFQGTAAHQTQLRNYSQLLFFCACCVAREAGVSVEDLDKAARLSQPTRDASSKYLARLRTGAKLAARLIDRLEGKLGHLASALFLLCKTMHRG